jgi:hypothetical protein
MSQIDYTEKRINADENLNLYDSKLEVYRKEKDIMYRLMDGTEKDEIWLHLNGIIENLKEQYGHDLSGMRNSIAYSTQKDQASHETKTLPPLSSIIEILEWMRDNNDENIRAALWFYSIYSRPPLQRWLENAPLNDREQFRIFRDRVLAPECEKLIGGHGPSIDNFVRTLRVEYINRCALPIPSTEEQFSMASQDI